MTWLRRIGALFMALGALWAALTYRRQAALADSYDRKAEDLERAKGDAAAEARIAAERSLEAALKAEAALAKGRANIEQIKGRTDESFVARLDALNRRLRGD